MKENKKKIIIAVAVAAALFLVLAASVIISLESPDTTYSGTVNTPTYLQGERPSEYDSNSSIGENPSEGISENPTEVPTEEPTELPTEPPTEAPTEAPTEPPPSLEYESFGNGTCAVVGIGDIDDPYVVIPERNAEGDVVTTIKAGAFDGNSSITVIQIPSTVYSIGELAFADCKSLVHISVQANNAHFRDIDGVLFDMNLTTLICYPSAKASTSLLLPETITKICDMALYGCNSLKMIKFEGTVEAWSQVQIGDKNYSLYTASLSFSNKED